MIEIMGQPNSTATVNRKNISDNNTTDHKTGQMSADDVNELLRLVDQLTGMPSDDKKDIFGQGLRLEVQTPTSQWGNGEEAAGAVELGDETKQTFKDVADSIEAAARQFAKADAPI